MITAKLNTYGFNLAALRLIHDYLSNRKQQTKIDDSYSWLVRNTIWCSIRTTLFNIFLVDFSLVEDNIEYLIASLEEAPNAYLIGSKTIA